MFTNQEPRGSMIWSPSYDTIFQGQPSIKFITLCTLWLMATGRQAYISVAKQFQYQYAANKIDTVFTPSSINQLSVGYCSPVVITHTRHPAAQLIISYALPLGSWGVPGAASSSGSPSL